MIWVKLEWEYVEHNQLWNHTLDVSGNTNANKLIYKISQTININSEGNGDINTYGAWTHTTDLSANNIKIFLLLTSMYVKLMNM